MSFLKCYCRSVSKEDKWCWFFSKFFPHGRRSVLLSAGVHTEEEEGGGWWRKMAIAHDRLFPVKKEECLEETHYKKKTGEIQHAIAQADIWVLHWTWSHSTFSAVKAPPMLSKCNANGQATTNNWPINQGFLFSCIVILLWERLLSQFSLSRSLSVCIT